MQCQVFERYNMMGGNRPGLTLTMFQNTGQSGSAVCQTPPQKPVKRCSSKGNSQEEESFPGDVKRPAGKIFGE